MKILILGGDGMLGHRLFLHLRGRHDVRVTLRQDAAAYATYDLFPAERSYFGVDVRSSDRLTEVMADFRPGAVVNAVGIVKQRASAREAIPSLEINALLPHRLAVLCAAAGARLVHVSTDCVFTGSRGAYCESDSPDAVDLYGRTKFLGEVTEEPHCITLRTSIIGAELSRRSSLVEWFLAQRGTTVRGFTNAIFSGFTTAELSRIIEMLLLHHPEAHGLYHVSADPIDKHTLLTMIRDRMGLDVRIEPDDSFHCDRSLDSTRFRGVFGYSPPSWESMIQELSKELEGSTR